MANVDNIYKDIIHENDGGGGRIHSCESLAIRKRKGSELKPGKVCMVKNDTATQ